MGTGFYNLVGNNRFTSISLSAGRALVTPSSGDYIPFRSGDVLGFSVESTRDGDRGVVMLTTESFTSELVWHASVASQNWDCPYSVGSNGVLNTLTRAAPVISISTSMYYTRSQCFSLNCQMSFTLPDYSNLQVPSNDSHTSILPQFYRGHGDQYDICSS